MLVESREGFCSARWRGGKLLDLPRDVRLVSIEASSGVRADTACGIEQDDERERTKKGNGMDESVGMDGR